MRVVLTKLTNDRHRLAIHRRDGSSESAELETRSFLLHDLVHYAVEAEAPIAQGFWGLLASGTRMADLADRTMIDPARRELWRAEHLVGPMQSLWNGVLERSFYLEHARTAGGDLAVDDDFVDRVQARLRALVGCWKATPWRASMELGWPATAPRTVTGPGPA